MGNEKFLSDIRSDEVIFFSWSFTLAGPISCCENGIRPTKAQTLILGPLPLFQTCSRRQFPR